MTELLYRDDPYLAACEARVVLVSGVARIRSEGKRNKRVTLVMQ